jgi:hypothetical protein
MLDTQRAREEDLLLPIITSDAAKGRVLVLGTSPFAVSWFLHRQDVREVIYCPGDDRRLGEVAGLKPALLNKLRVTEPGHRPHTLQRKHLGIDHVDFLFVATDEGPWAIGREDFVRRRARQFRATAVGYRYQELDVVTHWIAAGCTLEDIDATAFATFATATGLLVTATDAKRCAALAIQYAGQE